MNNRRVDLAVNPDWLRDLHARASQPPLRPRQPLWAGQSVVGSVETDFFSRIDLQPNKYVRKQLLKEERHGVVGWAIQGHVTALLNHLATVMRDAGLAGAWRDEQLAVCDEAGQRVGTIERAAVRPLGITTHAVHLAAQTADGRHWVQQRALDKSVDPGLWDTLMGGMISAADTVETALQRETWEEAGLQIDDLKNLRFCGRETNCRPSGDGAAGYLREFIDWYVCTVPDDLVPINLDGEVAQFVLMDRSQLLVAMQRGEFTLEAAFITASLLGLVGDYSISSLPS